MSFCRDSWCPSVVSLLTSHDTMIPAPAPPCSANTLYCCGLSETIEVRQRAEGCGWMLQHPATEKRPAVTLSASALWKKQGVIDLQCTVHISIALKGCWCISNKGLGVAHVRQHEISWAFFWDEWIYTRAFIPHSFIDRVYPCCSSFTVWWG